MPTYRPEIIGLKFLDILLLSGYYFVAGLLAATLIDFIAGKFSAEKDDKKSTTQLLIEAILYTFGLLIVFYITRNIIERIPFPFDGVYGFKHSLVKEKSGDIVFVFVLFYFQKYYVEKLQFLHNRLVGQVSDVYHGRIVRDRSVTDSAYEKERKEEKQYKAHLD
jgi:hypothetical protein